MNRAEKLRQIDVARSILLNRKFVNMEPDEQRVILRSLLEKGLPKEDLVTLASEPGVEINANNIYSRTRFNILDKAVLTRILLNLDPKDVLTTCEVDKQFAAVCRDKAVFSRLIKAHYPWAFETQNPRQQYIAITTGVETFYRMDRVGDDFVQFKDPVQIGKSSLPENIPGWSFGNIKYDLDILRYGPMNDWLKLQVDRLTYNKIIVVWDRMASNIRNGADQDMIRSQRKILDSMLDPVIKQGLAKDRIGTEAAFGDLLQYAMPAEYRQDHDNNIVFKVRGNSIPKGTKAWLLILQSHSFGVEDQVEVYRSREEMAKEFVKDWYDYLLDQLGQYLGDHVYEAYGEDSDEYRLVQEKLDAGIEDIMRLAIFNNYLVAYKIAIVPFTRENLYRHVMTHDEFRLFPGSERDWWLFRPVTF